MQPSRTRHIVLAGLCMAAALAYITRGAISAAESTVRTDLHLTKEQSGWLMSLFFWPYALCQIPSASVAQRLGARRALPLFGILWSLASAGMAAGSFAVMLVMRLLMGVSQAGLVPVGYGIIARWFPRAGQGLASGWFAGCMSAGGAIAAPLSAWLTVTCGWRWMFALVAVPGVLWALWFTRWLRDHPAGHPRVNAVELQLIHPGFCAEGSAMPAAHPPVPWRLLLSRPAIWWICAQQFCRAAGYIFFSSWFATYLQEARGVTIIGSGLLTTLPLLGDVAGSLLGGALSDAVLHRTGNQRLARQGLTILAMLLCAGLILVASFCTNAIAIVLIISTSMFCAAIGNPCASAVVMGMSGEHVAMVGGTMNMCGNLGAALFPLAVPWLLHVTGSWNAVLLGFGTLYVAAAACWWLLKAEGSVFAPAPRGAGAGSDA